MQGGMKVYAGAPAAARHYVEADRSRADDYYLAEGSGVARHFTAGHGQVTELAPLTGEAYETWVAGRDPATGEPRGQLRHDEHAVRFVEVIVNGPKTWSIAAALHPDIARAYEAAQDRAAGPIIAWLSEHATTRVGPRGGQVPMPVEVLEAATVRHFTSRAGDPHWHVHLQFLSRVFAAGKWRGLFTVDVRDSLAAINGIGHAAMDTDPELNAAFAANGYAKDATGEILELSDYVGPFSARHAQIARNADRYEQEWTAAHPGEHPGPALRRSWDTRAWAEGRPDKVTPQSGTNVTERWRTELHRLGFRPPSRPVPLVPTPVAALNRAELVGRALTRLAAGRSAWNAADVRGEVERLIAAEGIVTGPAVRIELAEDLAARALGRCVPLLDRDGIPKHIRAWTSRPVLAVEADLTARLAVRAVAGTPDTDLTPLPTDLTPPAALTPGAGRLDAGQAAAVTALVGNRPLLVMEGAAGVGKTTTLAATRSLLKEQGRRLVVVTPTLKAAKVAAAEVGAAAGSAARLVYEYGWRWDDDGAWARLAVGDTDPVTGHAYSGPADAARLRPGDLLVVDEAGMLDQDTARAVLTIADECRLRVALLGDRHQLAAVGRGGVLDLAVGQVDADAYLTLQGVHRFTRIGPDGRTLPDVGYADLTLAMRVGDDSDKVFDTLLARGQIRLHPDPDALREAIAATAVASSADGRQVSVVVDTRDQAAMLNAAIRGRLVAAGRIHDTLVVTTAAGERIGVGDRVATRRNDRDLDVANRDVWIVTGVGRDGGLRVTPADVTPAGLVPASVSATATRQRWLPGDYVTAHLELAYATTAHGAQGDSVTAAHLVVGEHTGAASAYVGMTRGREANTAHLVAADADEAREQWVAVFARDRADLGPAHAAEQAAVEAARYSAPRPLEQVVADLHRAWTVEQNCLDRLAFCQPQRDQLREVITLEAPHAGELARLEAARERAAIAAQQAHQWAQASAAAVATKADRIRDRLLGSWDGERGAARAAAKIVLDGSGRLGQRRGAVARAGEQLADWADRWRAHVPSLPSDAKELARLAGWFDDRPALWTALDTSAQRAAEAAHPEHGAQGAAADARQQHEQARSALAEAHRKRDQRLRGLEPAAWTPEPEARLAELDRGIAATRQELTDARARIATLRAEHLAVPTAEPAQAQPAERLAQEHDAWRARRRTAERTARRAGDARTTPNQRPLHVPPPPLSLRPRPGAEPRMGR
jgi:exodeoxyribonuclease V alpha subunit